MRRKILILLIPNVSVLGPILISTLSNLGLMLI